MNKLVKQQKENSEPNSNQWLEFLNLGWVFAATMTMSLVGGYWLDRVFHTKPIMLLISIILGFLGCGYSFYRVIQKLNRSDAAKSIK